MKMMEEHALLFRAPTRFLPSGWVSKHLHIVSTYTLLHTTMEGLSRETVQRKPNFCAILKNTFKGIKIFKPSVSRAPSHFTSATPRFSAPGQTLTTGGDAGGGKRLRLDCRQGLISGNQYPANPEITPIDNVGDPSKGSGVAAIRKCFHPKSLQRSMNRQTYSECTVQTR